MDEYFSEMLNKNNGANELVTLESGESKKINNYKSPGSNVGVKLSNQLHYLIRNTKYLGERYNNYDSENGDETKCSSFYGNISVRCDL